MSAVSVSKRLPIIFWLFFIYVLRVIEQAIIHFIHGNVCMSVIRLLNHYTQHGQLIPYQFDRTIDSISIRYESVTGQFTDQFTGQFADQFTNQFTDQFTNQFTDQFTNQFTDQFTDQFTTN